MAGDAAVIERLLAGGAFMLLIGGAGAALIARNVMKRVAGLTLAGFGAIAALALWAPQTVVAGAAIVFAQLAVGAALIVRLQESYGAVETPDIDAADADAEAQERRA